jgi:hypothetical protein
MAKVKLTPDEKKKVRGYLAELKNIQKTQRVTLVAPMPPIVASVCKSDTPQQTSIGLTPAELNDLGSAIGTLETLLQGGEVEAASLRISAKVC